MDRQWLAGRALRPDAAFRLFCLPYAGGSATVYRGWHDATPPEVQVCALELPGRGTRLSQPPFLRLTPLVSALVDAVRDALDRPYALFGHSMGGLVAFELARALRRHGLPQPVRLIVSGSPPPDTRAAEPHLRFAADRVVKRRLLELNGTPPEILANEELMELMLPVFRADYSVLETYEYRDEPPLSVPLTVFGGDRDPTASPSALSGWRRHTSGGSRLRVFPGAHFFLHSVEPAVVDAVLDDLGLRRPDDGDAPAGHAIDGDRRSPSGLTAGRRT